MTGDTIGNVVFCRKCDETKSRGDFHTHKQTKNGLRPFCRVCTRAQNKAWQDANPERYRKAIADWWRANQDKKKAKDKKREDRGYFAEYRKKNADKINERSKRHYQANKPRRRQTDAAWLAQNGERHRAYRLSWKRENADKIRAYNHKRRASRLAITKHHTAGELGELLVRQGYLCNNPLCKKDLREFKRHIDHKKPISSGGSNDIGNLQWLCASCNLRKGQRDMEAWMNGLLCKAAD